MKLKTLHILSFLLVGLLGFGAQAEDVYNFYFQKKPGEAQSKVVQQQPEEDEEEAVEEIIEVDDDVLMVPDNWRPANKRYKKVYIKKAKKVYVEEEPSNEVATEMDEPKNKKRKDRGWAAKLGIGSVAAQRYWAYDGSEITQKTYVLGATYHMSRYFEVNAELHLPNGNVDDELWGGIATYSMDPQFSIGLGATPIHLNVFGGEFLAIGIDGGVSVGNEEAYASSNTRIYLGPRFEVNFSDHWGVMYAYKNAINTEADFDMHSFTVAYRW